jgi:hypothetical protein
MANDSGSKRVVVPDHVVMRVLPDGDGVVADVETETYHGLNASATQMWNALVACGSVDAAYRLLLSEFDVGPDVLRSDLQQLVNRLVERGLLVLDG